MDKYEKRKAKKFLLHFGGWLILFPLLVAIVFGPLILGLYLNHWQWLLLYIPITALGLAIRTYDV
jgi:hypothetical protein